MLVNPANAFLDETSASTRRSGTFGLGPTAPRPPRRRASVPDRREQSLEGATRARLQYMLVTFEQSSVVTVRSPDGRWFDVRIVPADGHRPLPHSLTLPSVVLFAAPLYGLYRLACRAWYVLRRSTKMAVEVHLWIDLWSKAKPPPRDRGRPVVRELLPDESTARSRAQDLANAITSGETPL